MSKKTNNLLLLLFRILFTFGLIGSVWFIFSNSLTIASVSSAQSLRVMRLLNRYLSKFGLPLLTEHLVRKLAHFAEFALLGFFAQMCLRVYTARFVRHISWPLFFCLLTAVADETLQLYSAGRSSQVTDVWIDFAGSFSGACAALFLLLICRLLGFILTVNNNS